MQKLLIFIALSLSTSPLIIAQNLNMELVFHEDIVQDCNDVWGFVDSSGIEYAVIGTRTETRIYSLANPADAKLVYAAPGARSTWRDMKYYNNHIYVTADQDTFGLTIIDVSMAPDSFSHTQWKPTLKVGASTTRLLRAHNLYIDEKGFCYLAGHNISRRGVMILDLNQDPKEPVFKGAADNFYSHDAFVKDDTLYSSELSAGFGIYDVTDKSNPIELSRGRSGNNFTHNAWLSEDKKVLFTTDEVASAYLEAYDISDLSNIKFLDRYKTNAGSTRVIPHNTHILGDYAITSWYTDGVIINDVSDPANIVKVGSYDTYTQGIPASGSLFLGDWGAYPYLPSGLILVSDINNGLFVFKPTYMKGAYLTGTTFVTDGTKQDTITGAMVKVLGTDIEKFLNGSEYKLGLTPGLDYQLVFSHPDFGSDTVSVKLESGTTSEFHHVFQNITTDLDNLDLASLTIFPNPANTFITIKTDEDQFEYQIVDMLGKRLVSGSLSGENNINISSLLPGKYILTINSKGKKAASTQFVKI